jgi:hypothetical protein
MSKTSKSSLIFKKIDLEPIKVFIHLSAPSGGGKTFIGKKFAAVYNVKDLDDFDFKVSVATKKSTFFKRWYDYIQSWIKGKTSVMLVGISYIFDTDGSVMVLPIEAEHKLYINLTDRQLLMQKVPRDVDYLCANKQKTITDIIEGNYGMDLSKDEILKHKKQNEEIYMRTGYTKMKVDDIMAFLYEKSEMVSEEYSYDFRSDFRMI